MNRPLFVSLFAASAAAILAVAPPAAAQFSSVRVQVIDVGQADGILVRTPNSKWVLIDAGQDGNLGPALSSSFGVDTLELAIGSHRHRDHIGGMDEVFYNVPQTKQSRVMQFEVTLGLKIVTFDGEGVNAVGIDSRLEP